MADETEQQFRSQRPLLWAVTLFGPLLLTVALLILIGLLAGGQYLRQLLLMACASMWLFGRFIILGGADPDVAAVAGSLSSWQLFAMVLYLDVSVATVLAFHLGSLIRIPGLGPKLAALISDGRFILAHQPWIRRATFAGLVTFVAFPLTATGSVGGSIFGRLLGLSRWMTWAGIVLGSLAGDGFMLLAADVVGESVDKNHPLVRYGGIAVVLTVILVLEYRYRRLRNQFLAGQSQSSGPPPTVTTERPIDG